MCLYEYRCKAVYCSFLRCVRYFSEIGLKTIILRLWQWRPITSLPLKWDDTITHIKFLSVFLCHYKRYSPSHREYWTTLISLRIISTNNEMFTTCFSIALYAVTKPYIKGSNVNHENFTWNTCNNNSVLTIM